MLLAGAGLFALAIQRRLSGAESSARAAGSARSLAPVEVGPVQRGAITLRRTFSGALEAHEQFVVAPKVSGYVRRVAVDIGDPVRRGQVVAVLDDAELVQAVAQADAELAVAVANEAEAGSALEISVRALERMTALREQGVASESEFDTVRTQELARRAHVAVTQAQILRAEAALETARIKLGHAQILADWEGGDDERIVAERFVDEGGLVSSNTPLLSIAELNPIVGVVYVPERDYSRLAVGLACSLATDAYPGENFTGRIERIAPVFSRNSRQVRVELVIPNERLRLKPGMFVRATLELQRDENTTLVPYNALTERDDETGIFLIEGDEPIVRWHPVDVGIHQNEVVEVFGEGLKGRVVTLGQELCDDGATVLIPAPDLPPQR